MIRIKTENEKGRVYTLQHPLSPGYWVSIFRKNANEKAVVLEAKGLADAALNHLELCKGLL